MTDTKYIDRIFEGDCRETLRNLPDASVDLIVTSPPYADQRKETYGGIHKNCYPGKWPNRFRDAWERCLHFTKEKRFAMYQEAVMVPMGDWRIARLKNLSETDKRRVGLTQLSETAPSEESSRHECTALYRHRFH